MSDRDRAAKAGICLTLGRDTIAAAIDWTVMVLKQGLARLTP